MVVVGFKAEWFLLPDIDVAAGASALFLNFCEVRALVPVGFGIVVVGDGIEPRSLGLAACNQGICHTHDRGGVHATAKLGEDGAVGTQPAAHGFAENRAEVLFVFCVSAVA